MTVEVRRLPKAALRSLTACAAVPASAWASLGPLTPAFERFLEREASLSPLPRTALVEHFFACTEPGRTTADILRSLRVLAPGGPHVGARQVVELVDEVRRHVQDSIRARLGRDLQLIPHSHAFGSGGDFYKTVHATTWASLLVAPLVPMCKTGTTHVTAEHGSLHAALHAGLEDAGADLPALETRLATQRFAFASLASLGAPYSPSLRRARRELWLEAAATIHDMRLRGASWRDSVRSSPISLDVFKIVMPNAQVLDPTYHATGVCHLDMIPYVLAIYLHLGTRGIIVHAYDGVDELCNASSQELPQDRNNLLVEVDEQEVTITEFAPEAVGLPRVPLRSIAAAGLDHEVRTVRAVMAGDGAPATRDFLLLNAASLLVAARCTDGSDPVARLRDGLARMREVTTSGIAARM